MPSHRGVVPNALTNTEKGDWGASGDDHGGVEFAPDLGRDVRAEESREEPVVVLAEDDHVGPRVARCVDDRPARLAGQPT